VGDGKWFFIRLNNEDAIDPEDTEKLKKQGREYFTLKEP
jgi:hypothetical protein